MEEIDSLGIFWISGHGPDSGLTGRLTISAKTHGQLHLLGRLEKSKIETEPGASGQNLTFHGWIDKREVTLLDCWIQRAPRHYPGVDETLLRVNGVLTGGHVDPPVQFKVGRIRTSCANDWIGERVVGGESGHEGVRPAEWLDYKLPSRQRREVNLGALYLSYDYRQSSPASTRKIEFEHWPIFEIEYSQLRDLEDIQHDLGFIESLVTLCVDQVSTTQSMTFERPDHKVHALDGTELPFCKAFEYIAHQLRPPAPPKQQNHTQMLVTFEELGGISTIARFLDLAPTFRRSLNSLMSVKLAPRMFSENRFLNIAFAAESYHRDVYGGRSMPDTEFDVLKRTCVSAVDATWAKWLEQKLRYANEMTLRNRLRALVENAGTIALPFLQNPNRWISVLVEVRNNITHLDSSKSDFDGADLYYLSESLYSLVRGNILQLVGVADRTIAARAGSDYLAWYADRLNETVTRLHKRL